MHDTKEIPPSALDAPSRVLQRTTEDINKMHFILVCAVRAHPGISTLADDHQGHHFQRLDASGMFGNSNKAEHA